MIRFNEREMLSYFRGFDCLKYKYGSLLRGIGENPGSAEYVPRIYKCLDSFERAKHHMLYNKLNYDDMKRNIELIYGSSEEADDLVFLYDFALDNLIDRYLNIPSLDKLFSEHYFEYEWRQHTDLDFKKSDLAFYRDHFIHQIRNCFMIMSLLGDGPSQGEETAGIGDSYYRKIEGALKSRDNDVSKFACVQVEQYTRHVDETIDSWKRRSEGDLADAEKSAGSNGFWRDDEDGFGEAVDGLKGNEDEYAWRYLIRGSLIVAALFHDIGYPVNFTYKRVRSISEYVSSVLPGDNIGFGRLNDLLENSLLFRTVERDELEKRYDALDHGALSAFMLLLQFYETGAIRELNPIKKAMIELAAVAIYDHTLKYGISGEKNADRQKPSFVGNPLSYTLRFVDDLQEWDRIYFEIRSVDDPVYCERCKMPVNRLHDGFELKRVFGKIQDDKDRCGHADESGLKRFFGNDDYDFGYTPSGRTGRPCICGCNARDYVGTASASDVCKGIFGDTSEDFIAGATGRMRGENAGGTLDADKGKGGRIQPSHHLRLGEFESGMPFSSQRIIYTRTSEEVVAMPYRAGDAVGCTFYIEYDAYRSLCLLSVNSGSLDYRMKELLKLNAQFRRQSGIELGMRTYMTNNPMMLKMRILSNFLYEVGHYIDADSSYRRNAAYFDTLLRKRFATKPGKDKSRSRSGLSNGLRKLAYRLKRIGFLVYDYGDEDEGLPSDENLEEKLHVEKTRTMFTQIDEYLSFVVSRLMDEDDGERSDFAENLTNTCRAYLSVMRVAVEMDDETGAKGADAYKLEFKKRCDSPFASDDVYGRACSAVFDDLAEQLYRQRFDEKGMDGYYAEAGKNGKDEMLKYALGILFDERFYNPRIMREEKGINLGEGGNEARFTFFDVYSDMYLFKEMDRFASDNYRRRTERYSEKGKKA